MCKKKRIFAAFLITIMLCDNLHSTLATCIAPYEKDQIVVVQDANISIETEFPSLALSVNESAKDISTVSLIWDFLFAHAITRRGLVIAVGGGVLTDLVGFAAATYKRGIDYINIPTTLLAMIDASSGGKTGFNYHGLKNSIGCFAPPVATLIWPQWLKTLPSRELLSGFGEMLKTGLINTKLWPQLMQFDIDAFDIEALTPLIEQSVAVKERIVAADPHEKGLRKALNFGHTFGHALEEISLSSNSENGLPHGYAVLYGLIAEMYLSVAKLNCNKKPLQQLTQIMLHYYGKPQCKCSDRAQLIALMRQDKKNECTDQINCTLLRAVGSPQINQRISVEEANEAWDYLFSL